MISYQSFQLSLWPSPVQKCPIIIIHPRSVCRSVASYLWKWTAFELAQLLQWTSLDQHAPEWYWLLLRAVEQVGGFWVENDALPIDIPRQSGAKGQYSEYDYFFCRKHRLAESRRPLLFIVKSQISSKYCPNVFFALKMVSFVHRLSWCARMHQINDCPGVLIWSGGPARQANLIVFARALVITWVAEPFESVFW